MTIAGGIMGALFHREQTGEATTVDVSLLGVGMWSMGAAMALSLQHEVPWGPPPVGAPTGNPLVATTRPTTALRRARLPAGRPSTGPSSARWSVGPSSSTTSASPMPRRSWPTPPPATERAGRGVRRAHGRRVARAARPFSGQWAMVQNTLEAAADPQTVGQRLRPGLRDRRRHAVPAGGRAGPVRREARGAEARAGVQRARRRDPRAIGLDWDTIVDLKVRGVVN